VTVTRVQGVRGTTAQSNGTGVVFSQAPQSGNVLIACIGLHTAGQGITVSNLGPDDEVAWQKIATSTDETNTTETEIWAGVVLSAGTTVLITLSDYIINEAIVDIYEYSGLTGAIIDTPSASSSGYGSTTDTGTTDTTTQPDELWIGATSLVDYQGNGTNGFTNLDQQGYGSLSLAFLEKTVSSVGQANSGAAGSGSADWSGCIATFKANPSVNPSPKTNLEVSGYVQAIGAGPNGYDAYNYPGYAFECNGPSPDTWQHHLGIGLCNNYSIVLNTGSGVKTATKGAIKNTLDDGLGNMRIAGWLLDVTLGGGAKIPNDVSNLLTYPNTVLPTQTDSRYSQYRAYTDIGHGNILFEHTGSEHSYPAGKHASLFLVMVPDMDGSAYAPFIATDEGLFVEKDIQTYGALMTQTDPSKSAGGGAILIGHGFTASSCPPYITLIDSNIAMDTFWQAPTSTINGYFYINTQTNTIERHDNINGWTTIGPAGSYFFDTLYLFQNDAKTLGNLYLGAVYATYLRYSDSLSSFDAIDDLAVLKKIKTVSDKGGKNIIEPESISHLKNNAGFYDAAIIAGWTISVEKKLLERIEAIENRLSLSLK
jgi:hypothetical protein